MLEKRPFNHNSCNTFDSCGVTKDEVGHFLNLIHLSLVEGKEYRLSEIVEIMEKLLLKDPEIAEELGITRIICLMASEFLKE